MSETHRGKRLTYFILKILGEGHRIESAGSNPGIVNPYAIRALAEVEIDTSKHRSKSIDDLPSDFLENLDLVITLCAEEVCPTLPSPAKRLHWALPDPAGHGGTDQEMLEIFRQTRDEIWRRIIEWKKRNV